MLTMFNTSWEVRESGVDTAVLPLGSMEPKGPHLPLGLDLILANRFAHDFCTGKKVYLLPVIPYSSAHETRGFSGAVSLGQETMWNILFDLASNLARHGFKRFIILDFSNYNWIVKQAAREINLDKELIRTVWVKPKTMYLPETDLGPDFGGGALETSLALNLDPGLVGSIPKDFLPDKPREYIDYQGLKTVAPEGYWGRPSLAEAGLGAALYKGMQEGTAEYVDYALKLFPGGGPLEEDRVEEKWWPRGEIPGTEGQGRDWKGSLTSLPDPQTDLAVIPTSATEQHSTSQPLATDYLQVVEWSRRVADGLKAFLLPALPIFTSWGHIRFPGTLTFRSMTAARVLEDVAASLREGGFKRAVLLNVHGGNWALKPTLVEINRRYDDFRLITTEDLLAYRGQFPVEQLHACQGEASFIKAFYPHAFNSAKVADYSPNCPASAFDLVGIGGVSPKGVWGYPSQGTPEQGAQDLESKVEETMEYITKTLEDAD